MSRHLKICCLAFIFVSLTAIFLLPRYVAVAPSYSDSYLFGYNNRSGVLLLIGSLTVAGIFSPRLGIAFPDSCRDQTVRRKTVLLWMGIYTAVCCLISWAVYGLSGFGESPYLIDRVKMLAAGARPYHDFEFAYGPLLLDGPTTLMHLHLDAEQSYFLFWMILSVSGVWLLAATIDMLDYGTGRKTEVFSLFCLMAATLLLTTGLNYTLFRFVLASYFALLIQRLRGKIGWKYKVGSALLSILCTVILLCISPEMALSFAVGMMGYELVLAAGNRKDTSWRDVFRLTGLFFGEGLAIWSADQAGEFSTLRSFSGGAYNFPILPTGHILLLFFCCGLATFYISMRSVDGLRGGDSLIIVLAVSLGTLFAALGRCDPSHVGLSAIGIMLVGTLLASTMPPVWKIYRPAFVIFLVLAPFLSVVATYRSLIAKVFLVHLFAGEPESTTPLDERLERYAAKRWGQPKAHLKIALLKESSRTKYGTNLDSIFASASPSVEAPFNFIPNQFGSYRAPRLQTGYFYGLLNAYTASAVKQKVDELRLNQHSDLILPVEFGDRCMVDPQSERGAIRLLFVYPFFWKVKHADSVWKPLCDEITSQYRPIDRQPQFGYQLWMRK